MNKGNALPESGVITSKNKTTHYGVKMRIVFSLLILTFISVNSFSQNRVADIVVVNFTADWCPVCKVHGERYNELIRSQFKMNNNIQFVERNLTNDQTLVESDKNLKEIGILDVIAGHQYTGMVYIVDKKAKKLISQVSISQSSDVLLKEINESQSGEKTMPLTIESRVFYLAIQYMKPGGMSKLLEFNKLAKPVLEKYGFKAEGAMKPYHILPGIGENTMEVPDQIVILSAPDENALLQLVMDKEYQAILPLRTEALRELTFIATRKIF